MDVFVRLVCSPNFFAGAFVRDYVLRIRQKMAGCKNTSIGNDLRKIK